MTSFVHIQSECSLGTCHVSPVAPQCRTRDPWGGVGFPPTAFWLVDS